LEVELFSLKDKRIKLLDVIGHLEDEEMQLVSEVGWLHTGPGQLMAVLLTDFSAHTCCCTPLSF
jgi:hypothetical protein